MKRRMTVAGCVWLALAGGALAEEETPYQAAEIAYRGRISAVDANPISEYTPIPMVFRLYDGETDDTVLWGRKLSVAMKPNGVFSVKLGDRSGTAVAGARCASLAAALAVAKDPHVGLTPGSSSDSDASLEFKARQRVVSVPAVHRAQMARQAEVMNVSTLICGPLVADAVRAANAVVRADDTLLKSTEVRLRLSDEGSNNVFRVGGSALTFTRFAPPMTEMKAAAGGAQGTAGAAAIAICADDSDSDVKAVSSVILQPGQSAGGEALMVQKFGEGEE